MSIQVRFANKHITFFFLLFRDLVLETANKSVHLYTVFLWKKTLISIRPCYSICLERNDLRNPYEQMHINITINSVSTGNNEKDML